MRLPVFTHIDQCEEEIGAKAAELLLQLLNNKERAAEPSKLIMKPALVRGDSAGVLPVMENRG